MKLVKKGLLRQSVAALYRKAYIFLYWRVPKMMPRISRPHIVEVELTNECNLGCVHCHRTLLMEREVGFMDVDVFKKVIDEMADYPVAFLRIVGQGEPTLHPHFSEMMAYASGKRIKIEITTNGALFELFSFEEIVSWDIDIIGVSVDGVDGASFNKIRKGANYDHLARNIVEFYEYRNRVGLKYPMVCIRNVILPNYTERDIEAFNTKWIRFSDQVTFNTLHTTIQSASERGYNRCTDIFFYAHLNYDGRVRLCAYNFLYGKNEMIGNVKHSSLSEIWQSRSIRDLRRRHYQRDLPEACRKCHETTREHVGKANSRKFNNSKNHIVKALNRVVNIT